MGSRMLLKFLASVAGMMELLSANLGKTVEEGFLGGVFKRSFGHEFTCVCVKF